MSPDRKSADPVDAYILPPGASQHDVLDHARAVGFTLVRVQPRAAQRFLTLWFERDAAQPPMRAHDADEEPQPTQLGYQEDPQLGQRLLLLTQHDPTLTAALTEPLRAQALPAALARAESAATSPEKIAALGPLVALLTWQTSLPPAAAGLLRLRLADPDAAVRRGTLFALSYLPFPEVLDWLTAHEQDPALAPEIARQRRLRGAPMPRGREDDRHSIEDEIAADPLAADAYLRHARSLQSLDQIGFALSEAQIALALARRDGTRLQDALALIQDLRPQLSTLPANWLPYIAQRLSTLLDLDRPHVVVEVADQLLPLLSAPIASAPLRLALTLAHRRLGRSALALSTLAPLRDALALPADGQAAAAKQVVADVQYLSALLALEADPGATQEALHSVEQALAILPAASALPAIEEVQAPLIAALLRFTPSPLRATSRALRFLRIQIFSACAQVESALAGTAELLADEPRAADVWLARAALLLQSDQAEAALHASAQAEQTLATLDRLFEDIDPLATLRLHQAVAHARLQHDEEAVACLLAALDLDARISERAAADPTLQPLCSASPTLSASLQASLDSLHEPDPQPRTAARQAAAACLRGLPSESALTALLLDFFAACLLLLDRAPASRRAAAGMTLLASLEAQLDLLAASGEAQAQSAAVHAAMAAMADALGL